MYIVDEKIVGQIPKNGRRTNWPSRENERADKSSPMTMEEGGGVLKPSR
jgi:hypothetical protein